MNTTSVPTPRQRYQYLSGLLTGLSGTTRHEMTEELRKEIRSIADQVGKYVDEEV